MNWQDLDFFFNLMQVGPFSVQNIFVFVLLRAIANAIFIFGISIFTALKKVKLTQNFYLLKRLLELSLVLLLCIDDRSQASNLSLLIYCYAAIDVGLAGCAIYALRSCKISPKLNRVSIFAFSDLIGFRKFTLPLVFTTISSSSTKRIVTVMLASQAATFELGLFSTCVIIVGKLNKFPINLTNVFIGYFTQLKKMDLHRGLVNVSIAVCHVIVAQLFFFTFPQGGPLFGLVADIETTSIIWLFSSLIVVTGFTNAGLNSLLVDGNLIPQILPSMLRAVSYCGLILFFHDGLFQLLACELVALLTCSLGYWLVGKDKWKSRNLIASVCLVTLLITSVGNFLLDKY